MFSDILGLLKTVQEGGENVTLSPPHFTNHEKLLADSLRDDDDIGTHCAKSVGREIGHQIMIEGGYGGYVIDREPDPRDRPDWKLKQYRVAI